MIVNAPLLDDGTPMPTRYWLVEPDLRRPVSGLESMGGVRRADSEVDPRPARHAHARYAAARDASLPEDRTAPARPVESAAPAPV